MRVLVTGSRTWDDPGAIEDALNLLWLSVPVDEVFVIVHGLCFRGADKMAADHARFMQWQVEAHPADWETYGKRAGFIRNTEMVKAGADICLAFIRDHSRGATHCAGEAERAGIPTRRYYA